ncbi:MAG: hypothetical protein K2N23_05045, partial [Clostridia bacterium]|nr:hypothetical protein [Clostridia bacterium]
MNIEGIIAVVSACFAVITSVASFTINFIQGRRERTRQVILTNRIKYMDEMREGFTSFIGLAHSDAIKAAKNNSEVLKSFSSNLFIGYGKIKTYIKPFYDIDRELLDALENTYKCVLSMLNGEKNDGAELELLRKDFEKKYLKYDWAYWKYIQRQKEGNFMNSDDAFDRVYYDFVKSIP